ncbi:GD24024 [Drosophila simulans]|uniref:GD24024 n=1 Tax=Drosophila simulans TaxID=7240 RepID=B4Q6I8_DROSI|nr:GD24024 [Drosophila simulans]
MHPPWASAALAFGRSSEHKGPSSNHPSNQTQPFKCGSNKANLPTVIVAGTVVWRQSVCRYQESGSRKHSLPAQTFMVQDAG